MVSATWVCAREAVSRPGRLGRALSRLCVQAVLGSGISVHACFPGAAASGLPLGGGASRSWLMLVLWVASGGWGGLEHGSAQSHVHVLRCR